MSFSRGIIVYSPTFSLISSRQGDQNYFYPAIHNQPFRHFVTAHLQNL